MDAAKRPLLTTSPFTPRPAVRPFRTVAGPVITVTNADLNKAATCVAAQFEAQRDVIRFGAWVLSLLPILYGVATWVFGVQMWAHSDVYSRALAVPGAPQSWGTAFIVLGVANLVSFERQAYVWDAAVSLALALSMACFMASFVLAGFGLHLPMAVSPAISYGVFALMFYMRAWLAWKSRTHQ